MKNRSNLSRIKSKSCVTGVTRKTRKTKKCTGTAIQSETHVRRSVRLSERQLHLHFSLPDSDDSGDEADEGAAQELFELSNCEENICENSAEISDYDDNMSDCDDTFENVASAKPVSKNCEAVDVGWDNDTQYFDKLEKTFDKNSNVVEDIGPTVINYFESIFDHNILSHIVIETNRYAEQNKSKNWTDVTEVEMKAFLGCLIVMGIHQLPALKHYWSSDPFLRVDAVAKVMTANRFKKIIENLHCNDNETQAPKSDPSHDKLHKVKPLLDLLNQNVRKVYTPSGVVCVDESMIPFKGRNVLKQYMPKKPIKWGYKVWCLCDAYTGQLF